MSGKVEMPIIALLPGVALEATSEIIGPQTETRFKMTFQGEDDNPNVVSGITEALNKHSPVSFSSNLQDSTFFPFVKRSRIPAGGPGRQLQDKLLTTQA